MTGLADVRRALLASAAVIVLYTSPSAAQARTDVAAATRDSLLSCATRMASNAGFQPVPGARRPGRLGMMRTRSTSGSSFLDGLRVAVPSQDSARAAPLDVRVTTFVLSRASGLSEQEVTPPPALTALADSIRLGCRRRS